MKIEPTNCELSALIAPSLTTGQLPPLGSELVIDSTSFTVTEHVKINGKRYARALIAEVPPAQSN